MYTTVDYKSKKALREAVASPDITVRLFAPGLGEPKKNGKEAVEGPHYPKPHTWYAQVEVTDGVVTKVLS